MFSPSTTTRRSLAAGNQPDAMDFRVTINALGHGIKADFARGQDFNINKREDFLDPAFSQSTMVL